MYTGKDGKFRFPVEKRDSLSPGWVAAIKPGYYDIKRFPLPDEDIWQRQNAASYSNWQVQLRKQDLIKPTGITEWVNCEYPESREAAQANIIYLKLMYAEDIRLERGVYITDNITSAIKGLESKSVAIPTAK